MLVVNDSQVCTSHGIFTRTLESETLETDEKMETQKS